MTNATLIRSLGLLAATGCIALLGWPSSARAIGPLNQIISDAPPANTLYDACAFLNQSSGTGTYANGGGTYGSGTWQQYGSGALVGVSAPENGNVCLAILTANHVAKAISGGSTATTTGNIDIGFGPGQLSAQGTVVPLAQGYPFMVQAGQYATYTLPGSPGPSEDLSIVKATVSLATLMQPSNSAAYAYYQKITAQTFLLAALAYLPSSGTTAANIPFTEIGYGLAGTFQMATNQYTVVTPEPDDARRFQNNTVTNTASPATITIASGTYFEPLVQWPYAAPSAAGGGAAFPGDSGGPYLVDGGSASVMVLAGTPASGGAPAGPIPVNFTDDEFAVHVLGTTKTVGNLGSGVPLVAGAGGSLGWALNYASDPMSIPEPGALSLAATGGVVFLLARRLVRRRKSGQP